MMNRIGGIVCVVLMILFIGGLIIYSIYEQKVMDSACQKIGYEKAGTILDRCISEGTYTYVDVQFICKGFFKPECKILMED